MKKINYKTINFKEPLIQDWLLDRLAYLSEIDKEEGEKFQRELFNSRTIDELLKSEKKPCNGEVSFYFA